MVVFFFQAEDGIRDYKVTGVQTCALPISQSARVSLINFYMRSRDFKGALAAAQDAQAAVPNNPAMVQALGVTQFAAGETRSEERRVGKECRSRWSPYH